MKRHYFLLLFSFLLLACCTPEPPVEEPPKAKGIYECFIDGEAFRANGPNFANQWAPNPHAKYTELSGSFSYLISNHELNQSFYLNVWESIFDVGTYKIAKNTDFLDFDIQECEDYYRYILSQSKDYFIEITHLDKENDIMIASYEFELINECRSDTISVHGSFDLEYSL